jgi:hypothetical protein
MRIATNRQLLWLLLAFGQVASATPVRHLITAQSSIHEIETLGACTAMLTTSDQHCNPAYFAFQPQTSLNVEFGTKAEEHGYETAQKLFYAHPTREDVASLFSEHGFQTYSGNTRLEAAYSFIAISYVPVHAVAALRISNPSLPDISAGAAKQSLFAISSGKAFSFADTLGFGQLNFGMQIYHFDRALKSIDTNIVEFTVTPVDQLVRDEKENGYDADIGLLLVSNSNLIPSIGFVGRQLGHPGPDQEQAVSIKSIFRRTLTAGSSWSMPTSSGEYSLGFSTTSRGKGVELDPDLTAAAISHKIGGLKSFAAISPISRGFGFEFTHLLSSVGIKYSNEKQDNTLQLQRTNHVYLFAKIFM